LSARAGNMFLGSCHVNSASDNCSDMLNQASTSSIKTRTMKLRTEKAERKRQVEF